MPVTLARTVGRASTTGTTTSAGVVVFTGVINVIVVIALVTSMMGVVRSCSRWRLKEIGVWMGRLEDV